MKNLDSFTAISELASGANQTEIVNKINELVAVINDLVPSHIGDDGIVEEE